MDANPRLLAKLDELEQQFAELDSQLADPAAMSDHERARDLSIKRAALEPTVEQYRRWKRAQAQIAEHRQIIAEQADAELVELARAELPELEQTSEALLEQVTSELVTADDRAVGSVILEVRAG
ncbi:MAG: PCRF domain-containing protein, partial [Phycisphaerae bacterium]